MTETPDSGWAIEPGERLPRKQLHDLYGGVRQGGVSPSSTSANVLLFTDAKANADHGYVADRWVRPDLFEYCGEGQSGDQDIRRYNRSIAEHREVGKTLRLFEGWRGLVKYVGEFGVDAREKFYYAYGPGRDGSDRRVVIFRLRPVGHVSRDDDPFDEQETAELHLPDLPALRPRTLTGSSYRAASESTQTQTDRLPFSVDPDEQDRALRAHAGAQNLLAQALRDSGAIPLSPGQGDPNFDLAWRDGVHTFVAEIKSIVPENESKQLRLGIGQALDYAYQLGATPVVFVDRRPESDRWLAIAERAGVLLGWPAAMPQLMQ
ncbi:hypothetical protein [Cellulomonas sp. P5_E12]